MKNRHRATDQTLQEYLDSLLRPAALAPQPVAEKSVRPFAEPAPAALVLPRLIPVEVVQPPVEAPVMVSAAPVTAMPPVAQPVPAQAQPPIPAQTPAPATPALQPTRPLAPAAAVAPAPADTPADWATQGRPQWGQSRFESLLFAVGGLHLAVPLAELGTIHLLEPGDISPLPGQAEWFMGLLSNKQGRIRVVDSALVVMPERYQPAMRDGYRYVITLAGSDWGLAVDQVANALPLDPAQVRWRGVNARRKWLAGTVIDHMCALLDPGQLVALFEGQDRRRTAGA